MQYKKYFWDLVSLLGLALLSPLYFYKLSSSSLSSWDEAWYGAIARNILERKDILILFFNDSIYSDHPPAGFWIMSFFQSIFGSNEFGVRIGSAIFGMLGLFLIYFLGKEIFSRSVGFLSALALSSTYWYLYRSRSGNLDIFLTFFFVLTFFLAIKASKNSKFIIPFVISFGLLILTKSVIPLTIIPALIIIFWKSKSFKQLKNYLSPVLLFILLVFPWFVAQFLYIPAAFFKYFQIGTAGIGKQSNYFENFKQIKEYLHFGVGKWFWPGVLGVFAGPLTLNKYLIAISVFCLTFFLPFVMSQRGQLWHLIPLYPFMILAFFGFLETASKIIIEKFFMQFEKILKIVVTIIMFGFCFYYANMQIKRSWYEFIAIDPFISDEAILSKKAGEYPGVCKNLRETKDCLNFYIDGSDFNPVASFYSNKHVSMVWEEGLKPLFDSKENFILITPQWRLDKFNISKERYKLIAKDRDNVLVIRK